MSGLCGKIVGLCVPVSGVGVQVPGEECIVAGTGRAGEECTGTVLGWYWSWCPASKLLTSTSVCRL